MQSTVQIGREIPVTYTLYKRKKQLEMANEMHRINVALENQEADDQTSMVEVQDMIQNFCVSILIDPGASLSYIYPSIVEKCNLPLNKFDKSWLV